MTLGPVLGLSLQRTDAVRACIDLCGPSDPAKAKMKAPSSIRSKYGLSLTSNAIYCSQSKLAAERDASLIFDKFHEDGETTLLIIKPDALKEGNSQPIIDRVKNEGFFVMRQQSMRLNVAQVRKTPVAT